tara:strand:+ start:9330 stop:11735 length:2406 start_codon:yes stop_codon:yes gene_type:complete
MRREIQGGWRLCLTLCLLLCTGASQGLTLNGGEFYEAAAQLRWLDDAAARLQPDQALRRLHAGGGQMLGQDYPTLGFRQGNQWLYLPITNRGSRDTWYLNVARPHLDFLDLYVFDDQNRLIQHQASGDRRPFAARAFAHHRLVLPVTLPTGTRSSLLFLARGANVIDFPLTISSPERFNQMDTRLTLSSGFYFGGVAIMCLFNLLIFLSIRDLSYLYYVLYLGTFGLNLFAREGLAYQWLWPGASQWNHLCLPALNLITLAFSILFSCAFLELKQRATTFNRWLTLAAGALLVAAPLSLLHFHFFIWFSSAVALPWTVIAITLAVWLLRGGYSPARYYLLASAAISIACVIYILKTFNVIGGHWLIENALQLGTATEAVLLSFALAHRMTTLKAENERIQREANEALERRVSERTSELNAALSSRSEFLAVMSHEIRTPLNGIVGTLDMLRDTHLDEDQRVHLHVIERSSASLLNLINDVFDYSRLNAGKMPLEQSAFELPALVGECVAPFEQRARLNGNRLGWTLSNSLGDYCVGDPVRLRQILMNLIGNAVKFTEDGAIDVAVHREVDNSDYVFFSVTDSGVGIPAGQRALLFEHFQQRDSSTQRRYGGTGLGLAICRQLAEIMGGEIGVQAPPGGGSKFWVRLPLPPGRTRPDEPALPDQPDSQRYARLLIVDDNHINLRVAEGLCRKLGHQCDTAESGAEALATLLAAPNRFDLILMDCEMPDMDGFETTRAIQQWQREGRLPVIPVIALTAHAVPDKIAACHDAGMVGHIAKPVNLSRLNEALQDTLRGVADGGRA